MKRLPSELAPGPGVFCFPSNKCKDRAATIWNWKPRSLTATSVRGPPPTTAIPWRLAFQGRVTCPSAASGAHSQPRPQASSLRFPAAAWPCRALRVCVAPWWSDAAGPPNRSRLRPAAQASSLPPHHKSRESREGAGGVAPRALGGVWRAGGQAQLGQLCSGPRAAGAWRSQDGGALVAGRAARVSQMAGLEHFG